MIRRILLALITALTLGGHVFAQGITPAPALPLTGGTVANGTLYCTATTSSDTCANWIASGSLILGSNVNGITYGCLMQTSTAASTTSPICEANYIKCNQGSIGCWAGYDEVQLENETNLSGYGREVDCKNKGPNDTDTPYQLTYGCHGLWLVASGQTDYGGAPTNPDNTAIDFVSSPALGTLQTGGGSITAAGSAYTNGTYTNVPLTGGTGFQAKATIVVTGNAVTTVTITSEGHRYTVNDVLSAAAANIGGTGSGFTWTVSTVYSDYTNATWNRGFVVDQHAITGCDGTSTTCIFGEMAYGNKLAWDYTGQHVGFTLTSTIDTSGKEMAIKATDTGLEIDDHNGSAVFNTANGGLTTIQGLSASSSITGAAYWDTSYANTLTGGAGHLQLGGGLSGAPTLGSNNEGAVYVNTTNGLSLIGKGSTGDASLLDSAGAVAAYVPTGTTNLTVVGNTAAVNVTGTGYADFSGTAFPTFAAGHLQFIGTSASGNPTLGANAEALIYLTVGGGLNLAGQGSSTDLQLRNNAGTSVLSIATGTTALTAAGNLTVNGAFTASPANLNDVLSPTGTGVVTINPATAGTINRMNIGATTAGTGAFTTLSATGSVTFSGLSTGTAADTVCYTSGGALIIQAAACTISSRRFKQEITTWKPSAALADILALQPVTFRMKPSGNKDPNANALQRGLIAEDVAKVDPKLAVYEPDMKTPKSYRQEAVIAALVGAVKAEQAEIDQLKAQLSSRHQ